MRVLIVESGLTRGALAACRALAAAGWIVGIGSPDRHGLAASSRYSDRWHPVPPVEDGLDAFLEATEAAVIQGRYEAVFCAEDAQALGLSFGRDRLSATVPYPAHAIVVRAFDKFELSKAAERVGMATPRTSLADNRAIAEADLPILVKPRLHWTPGSTDAPARIEAEICSDRDSLRRRVTAIRGHGGEAVLQVVVRGRLVHYLVIVDGQHGILGGVQTLAEPLFYPGPDVGQRVRSVSVPVDQDLQAKTSALMRDLEWVGMASLNLLLPGEGGEPVLVDFNGRYGASFDQYIAAGSNFPAIWAALATGRPLPPIRPPTAGVRFQWLEGDLRRAWRQRRGGLVRDVMECFAYAPGAVHTLFRTDDPLPALRFGWRFARGLPARL
jgi:predicted ATP-grasp superfamily ATP-dependent carboligase